MAEVQRPRGGDLREPHQRPDGRPRELAGGGQPLHQKLRRAGQAADGAPDCPGWDVVYADATDVISAHRPTQP